MRTKPRLTGVLVSHFHHERSHRLELGFTGTFAEFLQSDRGLPRLSRFRSVAGDRIADPEIVVVTYDELHRDPATVLAAVLRRFGLERPDDSALSAAVDAGTFTAVAATEAAAGMMGTPYAYEDRDARRVRVGALDRGRGLFDDRSRADLVDRLGRELGRERVAVLRRFGEEDWAW